MRVGYMLLRDVINWGSKLSELKLGRSGFKIRSAFNLMRCFTKPFSPNSS